MDSSVPSGRMRLTLPERPGDTVVVTEESGVVKMVCVCGCVGVWVREREREMQRGPKRRAT
jgi:hypothetical protein